MRKESREKGAQNKMKQGGATRRQRGLAAAARERYRFSTEIYEKLSAIVKEDHPEPSTENVEAIIEEHKRHTKEAWLDAEDSDETETHEALKSELTRLFGKRGSEMAPFLANLMSLTLEPKYINCATDLLASRRYARRHIAAAGDDAKPRRHVQIWVGK